MGSTSHTTAGPSRDASNALVLVVLKLSTSLTVDSLLEATADVANSAIALQATLPDCENHSNDDLSLCTLVQLIVHASAELDKWCHTHPVLASGINDGSAEVVIGVSTDLLLASTPSKPISAVISANTIGISSGLDVLSADVSALVYLVVDLRDLSKLSLLSLSTAANSTIYADLIDSLVASTIGLLRITSRGNLLPAVLNVGNSASVILGLLDGCGCVGNLGLGGLLSKANEILEIVLKLKKWCANQPAAIPGTEPSGLGQSGNATYTQPIVLDADHLLASLGLPGIKATAVVSGLGLGGINSVLGGLGLGGDSLESPPYPGSSPPNDGEPYPPPNSAIAGVSLIPGLLASVGSLVDHLVDLRTTAITLIDLCTHSSELGSSGLVDSLLANTNAILQASLQLGTNTNVDGNLHLLAGTLLRLDSSLKALTGVDLSDDVNQLLAGLDVSLEIVAKLQSSLEGCGSSTYPILLAGLKGILAGRTDVLALVKL